MLAVRPSHMVGRPPSLASTDIKLWIPCYHLLEGMLVKQTHGLLVEFGTYVPEIK
jgi:hypothetical protein